jgi:phytoene dehydrogenase-like protein
VLSDTSTRGHSRLLAALQRWGILVQQREPDVVVLGAGVNGLTAAAILAGAGLDVLVLEAADEVGGAVRTGEVTHPGYRHDLFSGFYPLALVGPIAQLPLHRYGLTWANFAQPYGGATVGGRGFAVLPTLEATRRQIAAHHPGDLAGWDDLWRTWHRVGGPLLEVLFNPLGNLPPLVKLGASLLPPGAIFERGQLLVAPARTIAERWLSSDDARVWFIGSALHSDLLPDSAGSGTYGLVLLGLGQEVGMPIPRGGAQALTDALCACIADRGGRIKSGQRAERVIVRDGRAVGVRCAGVDITARHAVLATVEPQQLFLHLVGDGLLPARFVRQVRRFEWGTAMFRLDLALQGLPTWRADALNGTGVLHLAESTQSMTATSHQASRGLLPDHPFLIAGIHTLADPSRAPEGGHTLWVETHAPADILGDAAGQITARDWDEAREPFVERIVDELGRFAPGIRAQIVAWAARTPRDLCAANANLVAGDISGGSFAIHQQLVFRPVPGWFRHRTPIRGLYMGGASTHPGGGVHGACGANAARVLLGDLGLARRFTQGMTAAP